MINASAETPHELFVRKERLRETANRLRVGGGMPPVDVQRIPPRVALSWPVPGSIEISRFAAVPRRFEKRLTGLCV